MIALLHSLQDVSAYAISLNPRLNTNVRQQLLITVQLSIQNKSLAAISPSYLMLIKRLNCALKFLPARCVQLLPNDMLLKRKV